MAEQDRAPAGPEYFLPLPGIAARWHKTQSWLLAIPFVDLPYTESERGGERSRHYLVSDVEAYERRPVKGARSNRNGNREQAPKQIVPAQHLATNVLKFRWRIRLTQLLAIPFGELPYRLSLPDGNRSQVRSYLLTDVEAYEARHGKPVSVSVPSRPDGNRIAAIRAMRARTPTPTYDAIRAVFGISRTRVRQILFWSGGDPAAAQRHAEQTAHRLQEKSRKLVPLGLEAHARRCDRLITALRTCAAREGYVPPAVPHSRFRRMVGCNVESLRTAFGSLNNALEVAGLPTRRTGRRRAKLVAQARKARQ